MAGKAARPSQDTQPKDFESALAELEVLVSGMETGQLSLEQSLAHYRRGMELVGYCQRVLKEAEQQVQILETGTLKELSSGETAEDGSNP